MEELRKQVRRAHLRLGFRRLLGVLSWCWFATFSMAAVLIAVGKFYRLGVAPSQIGAAAAGVGLLAALVWIWTTRRSRLAAAVEIDHRFGLKERVSSAWAISPDEQHSEAGRALIEDAVRKVRRVEVAGRFSVMPGRQVLLPVLPAIVAVLVALLISSAETPAKAKATTVAQRKQVKKSTDTLRRKLTQRRKQAEKQGLKDAERLFKKLEEGAREMAAGKTDRKKALVKLNNLSRELQERRKALGRTDQMRKQLSQLKSSIRGPADPLAKAIRQGDFKKAAGELQKLKELLQKQGGLSKQEQEALARQLQDMQQKLGELAKSQQAAVEELKRREKQLREAGQTAEADKLQQQLEKLLQQAPQMKQLDQLAQKLGQCAKCLSEGKLGEAAEGLDQLTADVGKMQQQLDEMEMLEDAMQQLSQARDKMNCEECGGFG